MKSISENQIRLKHINSEELQIRSVLEIVMVKIIVSVKNFHILIESFFRKKLLHIFIIYF